MNTSVPEIGLQVILAIVVVAPMLWLIWRNKRGAKQAPTSSSTLAVSLETPTILGGLSPSFRRDFMHGTELARRGEAASAIAVFTRIVENNENCIPALFARGACKATLKDYRGAICDFSQILDSEPNHQEALYNRAVSRNALKNAQGAISDLDKVIAFNPLHAKAFALRGFCKEVNFEDFQSAIDDYSKAIDIDPKNAEAYHDRGQARVRLGERDAGFLDLSRAGELGLNEAYKTIDLLSGSQRKDRRS